MPILKSSHLSTGLLLPVLLCYSFLLLHRCSAAATASFEQAAYCRKLCLRGLGGNLCQCNAIHFAGKRASQQPQEDSSWRSADDDNRSTRGPASAVKEEVMRHHFGMDWKRLKSESAGYRWTRGRARATRTEQHNTKPILHRLNDLCVLLRATGTHPHSSSLDRGAN